MLSTNSGSPRCLIPIQIETLTGTSFELLVSPSEQIQYIKRKIERREGIPMNHQHLIWKSTELDDEMSLNDYQIEAGSTIKLVLAMRGGPVNTRRVPIDDSLIRDVSEYIKSTGDECPETNDHVSPSNKNVTFLVLREGDQFNFFQVIDRGDGTLSPLSSSMSATSMYNAHETVTVEPEREYDEKRRADDQKTKQKMEQIRSKLKPRAKKEVVVSSRPLSSTKQTKPNIVQHQRRTIRIDTSSNLSTYGDNSSGASSLEQHYQPLSFKYPHSSLFSQYNILTGNEFHQHDLLHEEDSDEDDDDDDDDDSHDEDDDQKPSPKVFNSRSFSASMFYSKSISKDSPLKTSIVQHSNTPTTTSVTDVNSNAVLVDYKTNVRNDPSDESIINRSQALDDKSGPFRIEHNTEEESTKSSKALPVENESIANKENSILPNSAKTENKTNNNENVNADIQTRDTTELGKTLWTDDDDTINTVDECLVNDRVSTSRSILLRHQKSSGATTTMSSMPTLSNNTKKTSQITASTQPFYSTFKPSISDQPTMKSTNRPLLPLSLSKYRRIPANIPFNNSSRSQVWPGNGHNSPNNFLHTENNSSMNTLNESIAPNKRLETLRTPAKQNSVQSPTSATPLVLPPATPLKRFLQQSETKFSNTLPSTPPTTTSNTMIPLDNTKVTIETIGSKTVSALLRQNATIEPVDTSRGVGKHLVSLLTNASKDSSSTKTMLNKATTQDAVIEERIKLDSKLNSTWPNGVGNSPLGTTSCQSMGSPIYNTNKLPSVTSNRKSTTKCFLCKKKTGLATTYQCRCGSSFCSEHRYPEAHACAFDYKAEGKRLIERNNPLVTAPKLPKI